MRNTTLQTDGTTAPHLRPCTAMQKSRAKSGAYFNERDVN